MQLLIKQRVFSWGEKFNVYDEAQQVKYYVQGEVFTLTRRLHIYNANGSEVGMLRQKFWSWLPTFYFERDGEVLGTIRKSFSWIHPKYEIDFMGWHCEGDFMGWDFNVEDSYGGLVAAIRRKLLTWGDTYIIDYDRAADEVPILMLVLAIDAVAAQAAAAASSSN